MRAGDEDGSEGRDCLFETLSQKKPSGKIVVDTVAIERKTCSRGGSLPVASCPAHSAVGWLDTRAHTVCILYARRPSRCPAHPDQPLARMSV